jgi:serine/threonine protein kinase
MGQVYRAEDTELRRQVAIKVLPPEVADSPERLELVDSGHLPPVEIRNPIISDFLDETLDPVDRGTR